MRIRILLAVLLVAQLADIATFVIGVPQLGIAAEGNRLARAVWEAGGVDGVVLLKGAGILLTLAILVYAAPRFPRMAVAGAVAAAGFGILGAVLNTVSIAIAHG